MTSSNKLTEATVQATRQQVATQLAFFQALTTRAFENAERILALNIQTTRATLDQTSGVVRQLAAARDPRDLLALGTQSQQHLETAMAYSRKLFEITSKPAVPAAPEPATAAVPAPVPMAPIVTAPPVIVEEPVAQAAPEPASEPNTVASAIQPSAHPMDEADPEPAPVIPARAKPIAKAASKVAAAPLDVPHPAASPMPEAGPVAIPALTPVDAIAEPAIPPAKRTKGPKKR